MNRYVKGSRAERKLRDMLESNGYLVIRAAGSGYYSPDLIVMKASRAVLIEVKTTSKNTIYFREEQDNAMRRFYEEGFRVLIAVYHKGKFRFYDYSDVHDRKLKLDSFHFTDLSLI